MKKILSFILIFAMLLGVALIQAFAQENNIAGVCADKDIVQTGIGPHLALWDEADDYCRTFRFVDKYLDDRIECDKESAQALNQTITEVWDYSDENSGTEPNMEKINYYYAKMNEEASQVIIVTKELKYLLDFCNLEKNNDLYYPSDVWENFQNKLTVAQEVYDKGEDTIEVSNAYWDLLFAFNELCIINPVSGDVDFDGNPTVIDATFIQKNVAQLCAFNSSQKTLCGASVTILDATQIQKAIANIEAYKGSLELENLQKNTYKRQLLNNSLFYWYRDSFMPYNGLDYDNLYQPNLP